MTSRNCWSLHRLGWDEPSYVLQSHLEVITLGRSVDVTKQLLGKFRGLGLKSHHVSITY